MITFSFGPQFTDVSAETQEEAQVLRKYLGFGPWLHIPSHVAQLAYPCLQSIEKMPVQAIPQTPQVYRIHGAQHHA